MQTLVPIPGNAQWRKSTRSDQGENCVELWRGPQVAAVRDSKNTAGPMLTLHAPALSALLDTVAE
jgi:acyl-coenzyme A thioesterase PaaI-like protein